MIHVKVTYPKRENQVELVYRIGEPYAHQQLHWMHLEFLEGKCDEKEEE